jgi:hypothetical protein
MLVAHCHNLVTGLVVALYVDLPLVKRLAPFP